jgi:hypothetical protein
MLVRSERGYLITTMLAHGCTAQFISALVGAELATVSVEQVMDRNTGARAERHGLTRAEWRMIAPGKCWKNSHTSMNFWLSR